MSNICVAAEVLVLLFALHSNSTSIVGMAGVVARWSATCRLYRVELQKAHETREERRERDQNVTLMSE
jgi:hypothetical protein